MAGIKELIGDVIGTGGMNKAEARDAINRVLEGILACCAVEDRLVIQGYGVFRFKTRAARTGRNPQTGEPVQVPEKTVLTFKAS